MGENLGKMMSTGGGYVAGQPLREMPTFLESGKIILRAGRSGAENQREQKHLQQHLYNLRLAIASFAKMNGTKL